MVFVQVRYSLLQFAASLTLVNREVEELNVGVQRELVHGVNPSKVVEYKEESRSSGGTRPVTCRQTNKKPLVESVSQLKAAVDE